jgi:hypothetical protein
MKKKQVLFVDCSGSREKRQVTLEDLRYVMGAEVASGTGTANDPAASDGKPPGV